MVLMRVATLAKSLLTHEDRQLLLATRNILDELLETEEILRDKPLMKSIRESKSDVKAGRVYTLAQLKQELRNQEKL